MLAGISYKKALSDKTYNKHSSTKIIIHSKKQFELFIKQLIELNDNKPLGKLTKTSIKKQLQTKTKTYKTLYTLTQENKDKMIIWFKNLKTTSNGTNTIMVATENTQNNPYAIGGTTVFFSQQELSTIIAMLTGDKEISLYYSTKTNTPKEHNAMYISPRNNITLAVDNDF